MKDNDELFALEEEGRLWQIIAAEVRVARDDPSNALELAILKGALHGDASLTTALAERALRVLLSRRDFEAIDRLFLAHILMFMSGGVAANLFSQGGDRRGGVKNGMKSLAIAWAAVEALEQNRARNLEEGWAAAAAEFEVGEDMAKRHWMKWKKAILWSTPEAEISSPSLRRAKAAVGEFEP